MTRAAKWRAVLRQIWPLFAPLVLAGVVFVLMREPLTHWQQGEMRYDEQAIKEWVREARVGDRSLPELLREFLKDAAKNVEQLQTAPESKDLVRDEHAKKRMQVYELLKAFCLPPTKIYVGQLPLFPVIYRLEVIFDDSLQKKHEPLNMSTIAWDSEHPRHPHQYRELAGYELLRDEGVKVRVEYQLHAYNQRQFTERDDDARRRLVNIWMLVIAFGALLWLLIMQRRESAREHQRLLTEQQIQESKQKHLEEELRRQKAEHEKQEAERQALELKSQMFHSIGIMAKSYAHNIKNLLVRPNDLLRRCMEEHPSAADSSRMLQEIQQTLGIVTERLQEILQTVQRDPSKFERVEIDLNALVSDLYKTWAEQAETKWKMVLEIELHSAPLLIHGDNSHLQQTLENFLFNARDAISEMRNYLRKQARPEGAAARVPLDEAHRQALIAAAGWKGRVLVRTTIIDGRPTMEIRDNGIGMTTEARIHCMEPHFSTKRNNALYAGLSAGMGLGLSFVQMILEQHGATIEVESELLQGALFRVKFPPNPTATT